ncbi:hypothetical protein B0H14DRAFT_2612845 [Mycena olivaceomarginata]|nr:hypothetical protein B0H14DRAFT_2612845 [Mycena olivaceomarginata]
MNKFVFAVLAAEALKPPRFAMGLCRGERDRLRVRCMSTTDRRNQLKRIAFEDQLWHDLLAENWFSTNYDRARQQTIYSCDKKQEAEYGREGLAELPMRTQCEKGCNREGGDSADVVRSARAAARVGAVGGAYTEEMRGLGIALRCREDAAQERPACEGQRRQRGRCTVRGAWVRPRGSGYSDEMDVGRNRHIDTQGMQVVLQRPNWGAGLARGEDTAARWMLSDTGVPTGGRGAALLVLTTRGGGRADTKTGVRSRLHGTGVAAHGRRVQQRGGRKVGRMGRESAVARQIRDGYSDTVRRGHSGELNAGWDGSSVRTQCGHGEEGRADAEAFAGRRAAPRWMWDGSGGQHGGCEQHGDGRGWRGERVVVKQAGRANTGSGMHGGSGAGGVQEGRVLEAGMAARESAGAEWAARGVSSRQARYWKWGGARSGGHAEQRDTGTGGCGWAAWGVRSGRQGDLSRGQPASWSHTRPYPTAALQARIRVGEIQHQPHLDTGNWLQAEEEERLFAYQEGRTARERDGGGMRDDEHWRDGLSIWLAV